MNTFSALCNLFFVFFRIGAVTFGGGYAMIPLLERELAAKRKWTTEGQLMDYCAVSQATPGIVAVNIATFIGYNRRGTAGAIAATAGVVAPSVIIITVIAHWISNFNEIAWVQKALTGINVAVAALLTQVAIQFCRKAVKDIISLSLLVLSFAAIFFLKVNPVFIILLSAAAGILAAPMRAKKQAEAIRRQQAEHPKEDS